jgi:tRNA (cytidine/uridine-2'-O-)-methyltransferase
MTEPRNKQERFNAPQPPLRVVLVEPDIPPNTGNIARLCAGTDTPLHLIEPLGFRINAASLKRAGLDYWDAVEIHRHPNFDDFVETVQPPRQFYLSTRGTRLYTDVVFQPGDALVFGSETRGLPQALLDEHPENVLTIPMDRTHIRSINLANSVAIVLYEALRQLRFL